jgi:hypothetical protein
MLNRDLAGHLGVRMIFPLLVISIRYEKTHSLNSTQKSREITISF